MRGAVTAHDLRRVVIRIESDRQQMRLAVQLRFFLQLLIDRGEVVAHQGALIRLRASRIDKSECQRFAFVL